MVSYAKYFNEVLTAETSNEQELAGVKVFEQFGDDIALEKGLVLSFADAQNAELPGVVAEFTDKEVIVDFNHPLAGKEVLFKVDIINVEAATQH